MFVAYVTSGREKYHYETQLVGVFRTEKLAVQTMFYFLVHEGRLFDTRDERPEEQENFRQYRAKFALDSPHSTEELKTYLTNVCKTWSDSFYEDGWNFSIVKAFCQESLLETR